MSQLASWILWLSWNRLPSSTYRCSPRKKICIFHLMIVSSARDPKIKRRASVLCSCKPHRSRGCLWGLHQAFSVAMRLFQTTFFLAQIIRGPGSGRHVLAQQGGGRLTFSKGLLFLTGHSDRCTRLVHAPHPHSWCLKLLLPHLLSHRCQMGCYCPLLQAHYFQLGLSSDSLGCRSYALKL